MIYNSFTMKDNVMAKKKPVVKIRSYGIYSKWDSKSKVLPKIQEFTTSIPAEVDIEFGLIINIQNARGGKIFYRIEHPGIYDNVGKLRAAFTGEVHIKNNAWDFYLGDTIWLPIEDKCGNWRMTIEYNNSVIADKTFTVSSSDSNTAIKKRFAYL